MDWRNVNCGVTDATIEKPMSEKDSEPIPAQRGLNADKDYQDLLRELQGILSKGLHKAYKAVDNLKVQTYWQLGERIVREEFAQKDRADYGKYLVENLASDLGIPKRRLYEIVQFYRAYPIVRALHAQLSWYHYLCLIEVGNDKARAFYEQQAILYSWGYRELQNQIKSQLYEKTSPKEVETAFQTKLPAISPQRLFKDVSVFQTTPSQRTETWHNPRRGSRNGVA
jgi:hypothetical protein